MSDRHFRSRGYMLLVAIIAIHIFAILLLVARAFWETEVQRDLEDELIFRGRQYVTAIDLYQKNNSGLPPRNLEILFEKNFLRRQFKDPMSESGEWSVLVSPGRAGDKTLIIIPPELTKSEDIINAINIPTGKIVGVCSSSCEEGFREYRKKKKYCEWAFFVGDTQEEEMPPLKKYGEYEDSEGGIAGDDATAPKNTSRGSSK